MFVMGSGRRILRAADCADYADGAHTDRLIGPNMQARHPRNPRNPRLIRISIQAIPGRTPNSPFRIRGASRDCFEVPPGLEINPSRWRELPAKGTSICRAT